MALVVRMWKILQDKRGIETAEWIAILAIVLAIAWVVYDPTAGTGLGKALTTVGENIAGALSGVGPK